MLLCLGDASLGLAQVRAKKLAAPSMPDLTTATQAADRSLDSPIDLETPSATIEDALLKIAKATGRSIRIDLPTLMGRRVVLSDPAPLRLKSDTLRLALQQLLAPATSVSEQPVPVSGHEGAIHIDAFRWGSDQRGGGNRQGRWVIEGRVINESGQPVPQANVRLYCWAWVVLTTANEAGRFSATLPTNGKLEVEAWDATGEQRGWVHVGHASGTGAQNETPTVTLKASKRVSVRVADSNQHPAEGARVVLIGGGFPYDGTLTSSSGESTVRIPADLEVEAVIALKHGAGLDYRAAREFGTTRGSAGPLLSADQPLQLQLSQAPAVRFRVVDQFDQPVTRYPLDPWVLDKKGEGGDFNLTHLHARETHFTDADGMVAFDWLPAWQTDKVNFSGWGSAHSRADVNLTIKDASASLQTIHVERFAAVRGNVIGMDGKPARNVQVIVRGPAWKKGNIHFSGDGIADDSGRFEFFLPSRQPYQIVAVSRDGKLISPPEERIFDDPNLVIDDVDLYLRPALRVFGKMEPRDTTSEESKIVLRLVGDDLRTRQDVSVPGTDPLAPFRAVEDLPVDLQPDGSFSMFVGPGRYEFVPMKDGPGIPFELVEQTEYEIPIPPM